MSHICDDILWLWFILVYSLVLITLYIDAIISILWILNKVEFGITISIIYLLLLLVLIYIYKFLFQHNIQSYPFSVEIVNNFFLDKSSNTVKAIKLRCSIVLSGLRYGTPAWSAGTPSSMYSRSLESLIGHQLN